EGGGGGGGGVGAGRAQASEVAAISRGTVALSSRCRPSGGSIARRSGLCQLGERPLHLGAQAVREIELEQAAILARGAGAVAALPVKRRERPARSNVGGREILGAQQRLDRAGVVASVVAEQAEVVPRAGIVGVRRDGTLELRTRLGRLAPGHQRFGVLVPRERDALGVVRRGDRSLVVRARELVLALLLGGLGLID